MKKNLFKIAAVALLAAVACNKELPIEQVPADGVVSFEASVDGADTRVALDGKVAEYIAIARRSGDEWYVGALTDWNARELVLDLSFLCIVEQEPIIDTEELL